MSKNDLKLDASWKKYWLFNEVEDWNPILDPPDPENIEKGAIANSTRSFFEPRENLDYLRWTFTVEGLAIKRPKEIELFLPPECRGETPEKAIEEYWEMMLDQPEGSLLVSYDVMEEDEPTTETWGIHHFKFKDGKFIGVDENGEECQPHPGMPDGCWRVHGGESASIGISSDSDKQVPGTFAEINFGSCVLKPGDTLRFVAAGKFNDKVMTLASPTPTTGEIVYEDGNGGRQLFRTAVAAEDFFQGERLQIDPMKPGKIQITNGSDLHPTYVASERIKEGELVQIDLQTGRVSAITPNLS